jgi:hypothetical protein
VSANEPVAEANREARLNNETDVRLLNDDVFSFQKFFDIYYDDK